GHLVVADEPAAVPLRLTVADADAVHHAVAGEPVVGHRVLRVDRVRADPEQAAVLKLRRYRPGDLEVVSGHLLVNRRERPLQPAVDESLRRLRHRWPWLNIGHEISLIG